ncbi:putative conjugative transfer protein TraI [Orientia tsutsugamushi str. Gilliam]|uniref:Putative conjugative transfer protein TraI n=1 Tax=Orientia tsutsugamushi str. Gilliam TaxID=1359184 RepID=A0A0F3M6S3_ORITS|nr:putative conjugative transfer protein TraI [Orientia tsutsugamushi str. Gilliam]
MVILIICLQSCGEQSIRDIIEPEITKLTKAVETTKLTQTENNSIAKQNEYYEC